jgi:hypothetical protein
MKDHLGDDLPVSNIHSNINAGEVGRALRPGFPRSMLLPAAASGRLLAMLRKNGLTTAAIKEAIAAPWARTAVGKVTGSREDAIVRLLSSPRQRANIFVWTADNKKSVRSYYYVLSPESRILSGFAPDWQTKPLVSSILESACPVWNRISAALPKGAFRGSYAASVNVFMLWPSLELSLRCWSSLDTDAQQSASDAAFALSTLAGDDWFVRRAIELVPELVLELGGLLVSGTVAAPRGDQGACDVDQAPVQVLEEATLSMPTEPSTLDHLIARWRLLGEQIADLEQRWRGAPSRQLIAELSEMAKGAEGLGALFESEEIAAEEAFERALTSLSESLSCLKEEPAASWLGNDDIAQISERWNAERQAAIDDVSLLKLAQDCETAIESLKPSLSELSQFHAEVTAARATVESLEHELGGATNAMQRLESTRSYLASQELLIAAEDRWSSAMHAFVAAASPRGGAVASTSGNSFQQRAQSDSSSQEETLDVKTHSVMNSQDFSSPAVESDVGHANSATLLELDVEEDDRRENPGTKDVDDPESTLNVASSAAVAESLASEEAPATESAIERGDENEPTNSFTDVAGNCCRPIWRLLQLGRPALAFQYASALAATEPEIRVPPPALLKCVALAPGLVAGDGSLAMSIGEAFAELEAGWFEPGDAPTNWHTALNLLLVAATLRPMMQAPATGAAVVAAYRHLDGRHEAVLQLVMKVQGVSEVLTRFPVDATALQLAADESSLRAQIDQIAQEAADWLQVRAPNKKNRYAPASQVWLQWLKPGEFIHELVAPVANGETARRATVRAVAERLSSYTYFLERLEETDRRQLKRRGQDIEGGALDNLWTSTCEAVAIAKGWLTAIGMLSESGGTLRNLIGQLQSAFEEHAAAATKELAQHWPGDEWRQVSAASEILQTELNAISEIFKRRTSLALSEPQARELLARDLLLVPAIPIGDAWNIEAPGAQVISELATWSESPLDATSAVDARIQKGDVVGAESLTMRFGSDSGEGSRIQAIERAKDQWIRDIQRCIQQARRSSEVGLAFGYLSDSERAAFEGELSGLEALSRDSGRFDNAMRKVASISSRIEAHKNLRVDEKRAELERERPRMADDVAAQVEAPLARSDIHTFNELMQRVRQGADPWPALEQRRDAFREFYPSLQSQLHEQLSNLDPAEVDKLIGAGGEVGPISFNLDEDEHARQEAEQIYRIWATAVSRHLIARDSLRKILEAFGLVIRSLEPDKGSSRGFSSWTLQTLPLDDREICPVPHFGSRAQGRYRVVCITDRLAPEDLLQRIGGETQQIATIVLTLTRSPQRFWPELARASKERQRSFLLLDEPMLLYLLSKAGSRLATWFGVALPFTYSDPYDASAGFVPPEMFYGRASELESVKTQGGCYFIYGGRQLGKTALLRRAEKTFHDPSADRYAVWLDLLAQGIGERRPASEVWLSVFDKLRELRIAGLDIPVINPAKPSSVDAGLSAIKTFLSARPGRRILLLLDEADRFFEQDGRNGSGYTETRRLKQLMDETERRFKVVFAGLHNVLRTATTSNQPLGHLNEAVRVGPLLDEREIRAAEDLITRPIEAAGYEFEDRSLIMRVLAQTNYYPSLIQLYCTQLLRHLRETKMHRRGVPGPRFRIEEADIESVFSGRALRDAIRAKFRLTLQLDDRYEVIANAIGLEALTPGFDHVAGIEWRKIWHDCRTVWWAEGFLSTTERDFLALLEEMVQLGVLSQARSSDHFSLRNPNVLLLLGSKHEIENTLQAEREPRIEFESTIFRPALGGRVDDPARNPLTYRQLDEVMQYRNSVLLVAASLAAGSANLLPGLRDQPGMTGTRLFVSLEGAVDKKSFRQQLDREATRRVPEGITVMMVPSHVPWDSDWVAVAQAKLKALTSVTSFISVVFVANPQRLWELAGTSADRGNWIEPWLSVLPWSRGFVRKWLEELQLAADSVDRLKQLTGYWGGLLEAAGRVQRGALDFADALERMGTSAQDPDWIAQNRFRLTGGISEAESVLSAMSGLGDGVTEADLVEYAELPLSIVQRTIRWAEPLGLITQEPGGFWTLDPFAKRMLSKAVV